MGFLTNMLSPENPAAPLWPASEWFSQDFGTANTAGIQLNELNSRSAGGVLAFVRVISEACAAYPKEIFQDLQNGKRLAKEHSLWPIIHDTPNSQMTNFVFWNGVISQTCIWGNGYAQIQRDGANRPRALWPMQSSSVKPRRENGVLRYQVTVNGGIYDLASADVLHIPFLSFDGIQGTSPIQLRRQGLALSMAAERFGAMLFGKGARPSGILETTGTLKPEAKANLKRSWQEGNSGANALGVALLEPGVTFKPLMINPNDAQFLETRKYQLEDIARDYRVPGSMVGILERVTHSNAEQLGYDFNTYTMLAWVQMIEQELNRKLFSGTKFYVKLDMDVFLRGDFKTRMDGYNVMRTAGVLSANAINGREGWPMISEEQGGDMRIVPMNMVSLEVLKRQEDEPDPSSGDTPLEGEVDDEDDPAGSDSDAGDDAGDEPGSSAEVRRRYSRSFGHLFSDATGRTIAREKRDQATVQRVWVPVLTALAESLLIVTGKKELGPEIPAFLADYAGAIAQRCGDWKKANKSTIATQEFDRAYTALQEKL